jgi:hypothetical protein
MERFFSGVKRSPGGNARFGSFLNPAPKKRDIFPKKNERISLIKDLPQRLHLLTSKTKIFERFLIKYFSFFVLSADKQRDCLLGLTTGPFTKMLAEGT